MQKDNKESSGIDLDNLRRWCRSIYQGFRSNISPRAHTNPKIHIDRRLATLAPPDDAASEEKEAFQVFVNDIFRFMLAFDAGKTRSDIYRESFSYFKSHPHDLDILLDIFTRGRHGVVDVSKFKYFDVTKLTVDAEYVQLLESIKESMH